MAGNLKPLISIAGNTGVGKSQFAVELAKALNGEIINGDAMQMYQGLDIITNKHPVIEREGIPHHLIGTEPWTRQITVQDFESRAIKVIDKIHAENKIPILVGGTHYYLQSLIAENTLISSGQNKDSSIASKSLPEHQLQILNDPVKVEQELAKIDPVIAAKFHPNDTRRLRRALEIWYETGKKPSSIYESQISGSETDKLRLRYNVLAFWVWTKRDVLAERLDKRVDSMIEQGLVNELREMYGLYNPNEEQTGIWQVLGFKQFLDYLANPSELSWKMGVERMKIDTRHYAKKQTKWIKNKLSPMLDNLGGHLALVDSSDLGLWDINVKTRGIQIAEEWLGGKVPRDLIPEELSDEVVRKRQTFNQNQWVRRRCEVCSEVQQTVLIGDDEWDIHIKSKRHQYHVKRAARELAK